MSNDPHGDRHESEGGLLTVVLVLLLGAMAIVGGGAVVVHRRAAVARDQAMQAEQAAREAAEAQTHRQATGRASEPNAGPAADKPPE